MRSISKQGEPSSLTRHRCADHADYDNYADKDALRRSLVDEQRGLCCYCLSRIRPDTGAMKIEHWHCQEYYPNEQLDYRNLLGACMGNEGKPKAQQHCDTSKGNRVLSRNPADPLHRVEDLTRFMGDGRIVSNDPGFDSELNGVLNLNLAFLRNNRKATLDAFKGAIDKRGQPLRSDLERWLRNGTANRVTASSKCTAKWSFIGCENALLVHESLRPATSPRTTDTNMAEPDGGRGSGLSQ